MIACQTAAVFGGTVGGIAGLGLCITASAAFAVGHIMA